MALTLRPTIARLTGPKRRCVGAESLLGESIIPYNAHENRLPKGTGRAEVTVLPVDFRPSIACSASSVEAASLAWLELFRREL